MNKILLFCLIGLLNLLILSCSEKETEKLYGTGTIYGAIMDENSNEPLQGVAVTLYPSGRTVITGSNGYFEFAGLLDGGYLLQVSKNQFLSNTGAVTVLQGGIIQSDILMAQGHSCLDVLVGELNFGSNTTSKVFVVSNIGEKRMDWNLYTDYTSVLSFDKTSGALEPGESVSINVTLNRFLINADLTSLPVYVYANGEELGVIATVNRESAGINHSLLVGDWSLVRAEFWSESDKKALYNSYSEDAVVYSFNTDYTGEYYVHNILSGGIDDLDAILHLDHGNFEYYYDPANSVLCLNPEMEITGNVYKINKLAKSVLEIENIQLIDVKNKEKLLFSRR